MNVHPGETQLDKTLFTSESDLGKRGKNGVDSSSLVHTVVAILGEIQE